jgi:hypothetical protein
MRRSSSTWRSDRWLLLGVLLLPGVARPMCLPPFFEGGQRLLPAPGPYVDWLAPLLRQHEVCWRRVAGEQRIFVIGNSAVHGLPHPPEETFQALLNHTFDTRGVAAHVFNLAWINAYQWKDAFILNQALPFAPDVIVYPTTLSDIDHTRYSFFATLVRFFDANGPEVVAFADERPPGLEPCAAAYARAQRERLAQTGTMARLHELGGLVRAAVYDRAARLALRFDPAHPLSAGAVNARLPGPYDCAAVHRAIDPIVSDWHDWSILPYLSDVGRRTGAAIVVVNWPLFHDPVADCYSGRYTNAGVGFFDDWLAAETARLGVTYVDLHDALAPEDFLDSIHVARSGHRKIMERLAPVLEAVVAERTITAAH